MRPGSIDDALTHYEAARESLELVGRWLSWCHPGMTLEDSEAWLTLCDRAWRSGEFFAYYLFEREGGKFVGCCTINEIDKVRLRANLGYWIRSSRQGQGMATEAVPAVAKFGFQTLGLQRLEIVAAVGNLASQRVAAKIGATYEGRARNRLRIHGVQNDAAIFSLIPGDELAASVARST
jgi:ribosomal-protein-serine acetyltransferase